MFGRKSGRGWNVCAAIGRRTWGRRGGKRGGVKPFLASLAPLSPAPFALEHDDWNSPANHLPPRGTRPEVAASRRRTARGRRRSGQVDRWQSGQPGDRADVLQQPRAGARCGIWKARQEHRAVATGGPQLSPAALRPTPPLGNAWRPVGGSQRRGPDQSASHVGVRDQQRHKGAIARGALHAPHATHAATWRVQRMRQAVHACQPRHSQGVKHACRRPHSCTAARRIGVHWSAKRLPKAAAAAAAALARASRLHAALHTALHHPPPATAKKQLPPAAAARSRPQPAATCPRRPPPAGQPPG